jgi:hypothetical protein
MFWHPANAVGHDQVTLGWDTCARMCPKRGTFPALRVVTCQFGIRRRRWAMRRQQKTKGGPPKPRAEDGVIEDRIEAIMQLQLKGTQRRDVLQYVAAKEQSGEAPWRMDADRKPLSARQIARYASIANTRIAEIHAAQNADTIRRERWENICAAKGQVVEREGLWECALLTGDLRNALLVLVKRIIASEHYKNNPFISHPGKDFSSASLSAQEVAAAEGMTTAVMEGAVAIADAARAADYLHSAR